MALRHGYLIIYGSFSKCMYDFLFNLFIHAFRASIVPMFSFGETDIYDQVANPEGSLLRRIQNKLQTVFGLAPCVFRGRGIFQYTWGLVPWRRAITTVGK